MIQPMIAKIAEQHHLTSQEAYEAMSAIMEGSVSEPLISAFLVGLRMKGETADEITGCARAMKEKAIPIRTKHPYVIDTCGTGGDGSGTFNISTASAIVACAAGAIVAKHGNRSVSSKCGSADVLKALGINVDLTPEKMATVLDDVGISFLFAPTLHRAMRYAVAVRKELGIRTVFNILGPLTNPAGATRQLLGVFRSDLTQTLANVLKELGSEHALVVHGAGGLDECSTLGTTFVAELKAGVIQSYELDARTFNIPQVTLAELQGGTPEVNAEILKSIFTGHKGAYRDCVLLNAGAALYVAGIAADIRSGVEAAAYGIDSGLASRKLNDWVEATNS